MEINRMLIAGVILAAVLLILFLIFRNKKDRRSLEKDLNQPDVKPEKHEDESD